MKLPMTDLPIYEITIPSNGSKLKFRPYTVKERKILLMALEGTDVTGIAEAIKQIINNCVVYPEGFDIGKLAEFDLEYLFLNLRARSIGEIVNLNYICHEGGCNTNISVEFNISNIEVHRDPAHSTLIKFTNNSGVVMKYPTIDSIKQRDGDPVDIAFDYVVSCIDSIFVGDDVYEAKNYTKEELTEFIESLSVPNFKKIEDFFETMPHIREELKVVCPKCHTDHSVVLEGMESFFD